MSNYDPQLGINLGQRSPSQEVTKQIQKDLQAARTRRDAPKESEKRVVPTTPVAGVGLNSAPVSQGLLKSAQRKVNQAVDARQLSQTLNEPLEQFDDLSRASNNVLNQDRMFNQLVKQQIDFQRQRKALFDAQKRAEEQASASVLSSLLGLGAFITVGALTGGVGVPALAAGAAKVGGDVLSKGQASKTPMEAME